MPEPTTEQPTPIIGKSLVQEIEFAKQGLEVEQNEKREVTDEPKPLIGESLVQKIKLVESEQPSLKTEEIEQNEKWYEYEDRAKPVFRESLIEWQKFKEEVDEHAKQAWEKIQKEVESSMKRSERNVLEDVSNPYKDERSVNFLGKKDKQLTEEKPDFTPNFPEYSNLWMESIIKMNELNRSGIKNPEEKQRLSQEIADYGMKAIKSIAYSFENGTAYSASFELAQENIATNRVSPNNTYRRNSILCDAVTLYTEKLQKSSKIIFDSIAKYGQTTYPIDFYNHLENKFEDLKERISFIKIETVKLERSGINQQDAIINSFKNTFGEQSINFVEEEKVIQNPTEQPIVVENQAPAQPNPQFELVQQQEEKEKSKTQKLIAGLKKALNLSKKAA